MLNNNMHYRKFKKAALTAAIAVSLAGTTVFAAGSPEVKDYTIIEGDGGTHTIGSEENYSFSIKALHSEFASLYIDDNKIPNKFYSVSGEEIYEDPNKAPEANTGEDPNKAPEANTGEDPNKAPEANTGEDPSKAPEENTGEDSSEDSSETTSEDQGEDSSEASSEDSGETTSEDSGETLSEGSEKESSVAASGSAVKSSVSSKVSSAEENENKVLVDYYTVVSISDDYMNQLSEGEHKVRFVFDNGEAAGTVKVKAEGSPESTTDDTEDTEDTEATTKSESTTKSDTSSNSKKTGDDTPLLWYLVLMTICGGTVITLGKKKFD